MSNYKITADGGVHLYGTMPNTNTEGWHFIGWSNSPDLRRYVADRIEPQSSDDAA